MLTAIFIWALAPALRADMGAIVPVRDVELSEPGQTAIILFNGSEQVLILGTDLKSSGPAPVLRFIPLPSEPSVTLAPKDCMEAANRLVKKSDLKYVVQYKGGSRLGQGVELVLQKKLGAHDITVVKVTDSLQFRDWVNSFLASKDLPTAAGYGAVEPLVADYLGRGIAYFAFDLVNLKGGETSVAPLAYRFKTDKIFYPLKTSNLFGGQGQIDLVLLAPCAWGYIRHGFTASTSAEVQIKKLKDIYPKPETFFTKTMAVLQAFRYQGPLQFDDDLFIDPASGMKELKPYDPRKP